MYASMTLLKDAATSGVQISLMAMKKQQHEIVLYNQQTCSAKEQTYSEAFRFFIAAPAMAGRPVAATRLGFARIQAMNCVIASWIC